jgi:hypothetical protein
MPIIAVSRALSLHDENEGNFEGFVHIVPPGLSGVCRDGAGPRRGSVRDKAKSPCKNVQSKHMKGIANEDDARLVA